MKKGKTKKAIALKILRLLFVFACLGGFLYQTLEFLLLYWTYPTVVDIQQIEPSYLEMPAFTICNTIGYNYTVLCTGNTSSCLPTAVNRYSSGKFCLRFPEACFNGSIPADFQAVTYNKYMKQNELTAEDHEKLRVKLEEYTTCTIEFAGDTTNCNLSNVMGSFYTTEDMPQYCYTIYSLWNQPEQKRALIAKGAVMHFQFVLNTTFRPDPANENEVPKPKHNPPGNPSVQMAVHSPYFLPSPFLDGMSFLGGRAYELRLKMNERHLLPPPYQTNCTDYMKIWKERGGKGPINQMGVVQECRVNKTYESLGCVPITLDYPHRYKLCKGCFPEVCNYYTFADECGKLADHFTQPCDAITYEATREDRVITTVEIIDSAILQIKEYVRKKIIAYDCAGTNEIWTKKCGTIDIYVLFDRFEITNLTYNPKFESLELFSVIGGYMGMWLGISLLTVYDFIGSIIVMIRTYMQKKREKTKIMKIKKQHEKKIENDYSSNYHSTYSDYMDNYRKPRRSEMW